MSILQQLREKRALLVKEMDALLVKHEASVDPSTGADTGGIPKADFDALEDKIKKLDEQIEMRQKAWMLSAEKAVPTDPVALCAAIPKTNTSKHFRTAEAAHAVGKWCQGFLGGNLAARQWCNENSVGHYEQKALAGAINPSGGFLVPDELSSVIVDLREQFGVLRQIGRTFPMISDTLSFPARATGVVATFIGENDTFSESDPSWGMINLVAKKLAVMTRVPMELMEDAAVLAVADWVAQEQAYAFAVKEDQCLINGDGTAFYGGMFGLRPKLNDGNYAASIRNAAAGIDTFAEVTLTELTAMMGLLPAYAEKQAQWVCSNQFKTSVMDRISLAAGGTTANEMVNGVRRPTFMGYPVFITQEMPTGGATIYNAASMVMFGTFNLSVYVGDRRMFRMRSSTERYFDQDQIAIAADQRFDVVVHSLGSTTQAGPIVALNGTT